nr:MAG TPA: hypothetical protein [Bacteriophage sp.]
MHPRTFAGVFFLFKVVEVSEKYWRLSVPTIKAVFSVFTSKAKKAFGFNSPKLGYLQQSKRSIWFLNTQKTGYLI